MTLQQKMILSGVISVLAAIALGGIGYWGQTQMATALAHNQLSLQAMRNHLEGDMMHDGLRADVLNAFVIDSSDNAAVSQLRSDLREHSEWFQRSLEANAKLPLGPEVSAAIAASRPALDAYIRDAQQVAELAIKDRQAAHQALPRFAASFSDLEEKNEALSELIEQMAQSNREEAEASSTRANWLLVIGIIAIAGVLALLTQQLLRAVLRPMVKAVSVAQAIAGGNLSNRIEVESQDEAGQLQHALIDMQNNLRQMIDTIRHESSQLHNTAVHLNQTSQNIVDGASEQADSATSVAAAMEQMIHNIQQVAENARNAQGISAQSEQLASSGGQVILDVVDGMSRIAEAVNQSSSTISVLGQSSEEIHSIIQVINSIAEQTNLLALNAAIEAARAGEAGRGFAVVADEVRNLAARTSQSTQEITQMIERIRSSTEQAVSSMATGVERVSSGVDLAQQAGASINQIRHGAQRAASMVEEISSTIAEQSKASNEVALRVEQISVVAQRNHASIHQLAAATEQMESVVSAMQSSVARFRL